MGHADSRSSPSWRETDKVTDQLARIHRWTAVAYSGIARSRVSAALQPTFHGQLGGKSAEAARFIGRRIERLLAEA